MSAIHVLSPTCPATSRVPPAAEVQAATDQALLAAIASGDRHAMRLLYSRHSVKVYRFILRMIRNEGTAEELTSDVFLDVWRLADRFEGRSQVSTWLIAIARNKALSSLRSRSPEALDEEAAHAIEDDTDRQDVVLETKDRNTVLRECLTKLSVANREIIDLVYFHEKTIEEIAVVLSIPVNTVKTRMFYARKCLAELLAQRGMTSLYA
jgi:RNA polymerase sigma-70 factor (ECF subfamily)